MRIVFVGGGSGGHFYPLIAIAEAIRVRDTELGTDTELYYMGPEVFNRSELRKYRIKYTYCPAGKQRTYRSILNFLDKFKIIFGIFIGFWKLYYLYPDVIMSKGGYTSVPVVLAAWLLKIPVVIHESDAVPGKANKLAARFARYIGIAHDDVAGYFPAEKVALVGMPIRNFFFEKLSNPHETIGIKTDRPVIFVTGGSQGAQKVNTLILHSLIKLLPNYTIVHQAGDAHAKKVMETASVLVKDPELLQHYYVMGHMSQKQMKAALQAATLVVSRAGSTTLFEIGLNSKPAIIIPIPEDVSRDQRSNAYAYARSGGAIVLEEHNLSDDILATEILRVLEEPGLYDKMSEGAENFTVASAAYTLADTLLGIGKEHE